MTKKLTFDALPAAVEKILEILSSEGSEHAALPELVQRIALIEKKIDYLQKTVSPDRPVMDTCLAVLQLEVYYRHDWITRLGAQHEYTAITLVDANDVRIETHL